MLKWFIKAVSIGSLNVIYVCRYMLGVSVAGRGKYYEISSSRLSDSVYIYMCVFENSKGIVKVEILVSVEIHSDLLRIRILRHI